MRSVQETSEITTSTVVETATEFSLLLTRGEPPKVFRQGSQEGCELQQLPWTCQYQGIQKDQRITSAAQSCPVTLQWPLRRDRSRRGWCRKSSAQNICLIKAQNRVCPWARLQISQGLTSLVSWGSGSLVSLYSQNQVIFQKTHTMTFVLLFLHQEKAKTSSESNTLQYQAIISQYTQALSNN